MIVIIHSVLVSIYLLFSPSGGNFLIYIASPGIGGFWAFFLGYFGWCMGQSLEEYFFHIKKKNRFYKS